MTSRSSICVFCGHGHAPADLPDHAEWPASGQTESARDQGELLVADGEGRRRIGTAYGHVLSGLDIARRQRDDQILGFGPDSNAAGNRNQWFAGSVAYGQERLDIPLTARYGQTGENVTIGSANAAATFTISYQ